MIYNFEQTKYKMNSKETWATLTGFIVGFYKMMVTKETIEAIFLAFVTGAAAWLGQTIAKKCWSICQPTIVIIFQRKKTKK